MSGGGTDTMGINDITAARLALAAKRGSNATCADSRRQGSLSRRGSHGHSSRGGFMRMRFRLTPPSLALLGLVMSVVLPSAALAQAPVAPAAPAPAGQVAGATGITRFINEQTVMAG